MFNKSMIALSVAITLGILGTASVALAGSHTDDGGEGGGFEVQTWQDIERSRQDIQRQIQREYHLSNAGNAYGFSASPNRRRQRWRSKTR